MATLIAIPLLAGLMVLQTSLLSRLTLLLGTADLLLLAICAWALQKRTTTAWQWAIIGGLIYNIASATPPGIPLLAYGLTTGLALLLRQRVWQAPILAMFFTTFVGTLITHGTNLLALRLTGSSIPFGQAFNLVILPSMLLNLILAAPAYALMGDLANRLYPEKLEV